MSGTAPSASHAPRAPASSLHEPLTLAVVPTTPRLQEQRDADRRDRVRDVVGPVDRRERRDCDAEAFERLLLGEPVLGDLERTGIGSDRVRRCGLRARPVAGTPSHS